MPDSASSNPSLARRAGRLQMRSATGQHSDKATLIHPGRNRHEKTSLSLEIFYRMAEDEF